MIALALSGGKDSVACLHLMRDKLQLAIYVDTGFSYPETAAVIRYAETMLPVVRVRTDRSGQNAAFGLPSEVVPVDWTLAGQQLTSPKPVMVQSYLGCCFDNISAPLMAKAKELGVRELVSGDRNSEAHRSTSRDGSVVDGIVRRHPIESWSDEQVFAFLASKMEIPGHFLIKHSSLDCYDCTAYRKESGDRIEFTKRLHADFYDAYEKRVGLLDAALNEAQTYG